MASPLLHDERALGVLSVLDRAPDRPFGARRARPALPLLDAGRDRARPAPARAGGRPRSAATGTRALVGRLASLLADEDADAGRQLLEALELLLVRRR